MIPFNQTIDNQKYEFFTLPAGTATYTFTIERSPAPFTQIKLSIFCDNSLVGSAHFNAAMDAQSIDITIRWEDFMRRLQTVLDTIELAETVPETEIELIWNRIINLIFRQQDNKIIVEE